MAEVLEATLICTRENLETVQRLGNGIRGIASFQKVCIQIWASECEWVILRKFGVTGPSHHVCSEVKINKSISLACFVNRFWGSFLKVPFGG